MLRLLMNRSYFLCFVEIVVVRSCRHNIRNLDRKRSKRIAQIIPFLWRLDKANRRFPESVSPVGADLSAAKLEWSPYRESINTSRQSLSSPASETLVRHRELFLTRVERLYQFEGGSNLTSPSNEKRRTSISKLANRALINSFRKA